VFYTPESPWPEDTILVQIDAAPQALARNFSVAVGLAANPKAALRDLLAAMSSRATEEFLLVSKARKTQQARLKAQEQQRQDDELRLGWDSRPMTLPRFLLELKAGLPPDVIVVGEVNTGRDKLISTLPFQHPGDFYGSRGGGIGQGLPGALGYHLAHPHRPLLAISADGSSLYSIQALWTAAHYRFPVVFVILNNRAYHVLKLNLDLYRNYFEVTGKQGYPFMDLTHPDIDFVQVALGFGVPAKKVVEPEAVGPAVQEAFASRGPYLLDVRISNDRNKLAHPS
jgi:benzoylformate decarboxylase